jgi:hypothetical protein
VTLARALAPLLVLAVAAGAGAARAQPWPEYDPYTFPLDPPLALPQQLNGTIRGSSQAGGTRRIERIRDVFSAMRACWRPPVFRDGPTGLQLTLRTSFNRNGQAIGKPQITYFRSGGDRDARDRFAASISDAFRRCMPLPFTPALGSAVAGRPFTFRFVDDRQT